MEHWNNKNAVIRDLERVSRGRLKVDIDPCLTAGKPVTCFGEEETEEEFFKRHCSGDANFDSPDLDSIRKLLFMVQGDHENYEDISDGALQVSKLNAKAAEFIPTVNTTKGDPLILPKTKDDVSKTNDDNAVKKKPAKGKRGNVAIASILAKQLELIKKESLDWKLLKPEDFTLLNASQQEKSQNDTTAIIQPKVNNNEVKRIYPKTVKAFKPKEITTNISKTNNNLSNNKKNESTLKVQNGFTISAFSSPSSMFRRKTPRASPPQENLTSVQTPETQEMPKRKSYVPSPYAEECYKKFVENSEVRKAVQEDLWSRTMRQMKTLDKKREEKIKETLVSKTIESVSDNTESVDNLFQNLPGCDFDDSETQQSSDGFSCAISSTTCASTLDMSGFPVHVQLPQYRHLITGECEVCKAIDRAAQPKINSKSTSCEVSETSVSEATGDALENCVDDLEDYVDASENSADALEKSVDTPENNVDALENSVDTSENSEDALETSIDALENSVGALENSVEVLETSVDASEISEITSENLIEFSENSSLCSPNNDLLIEL